MKIRVPVLFALNLLLLTSAAAAAGVQPGQILPGDAIYDPDVPTPASVLGFEVGEWHARHDQLVAYMERLAATSERVRLERQGRTHEGRPLLLLTLSSPANLARLEEILERHRELSEPLLGAALEPAVDDLPVVVWLGYSIHGNEASGANASLLVAYHLAAAQGPEIENLLDHAIVLVDPSLNPDGLGRFAQWVNMYRGRQPVADPASREHQEAWPGGRTNHYWFDLNRDWLLLQHPESRARVATLQRWRPNVVSDFHEMGGDATFFFQPGVPSRRNPLTPERNVELTQTIARYHAQALDREGRLYYTEETFDDFYYGKGSTYPDAQGAIGILFEQASVRGHARETANGPMEFAFAISNQFLTSLSTLRAAVDHRQELLAYQIDFFREAREEARRLPTSAFVFGDADDPARTWSMAEILHNHGIELYQLARPFEHDGHRFEPGSALLVPTDQRQARLVRTLFETVTEFADTTFYDISTWTLPLAFGLPYAAIPRDRIHRDLAGARIEGIPPLEGRMSTTPAPYAWAFEWSGYFAPRALGRLLAAGVQARMASRAFEADTDHGRHTFAPGTIVVPAGLQTVTTEVLKELLATAAREDAVDIHALTTGLTPAGVDLGSPNLRPLKPPKPVLVIGDGVSAYEAGEVWYLLDHRFGLELSMVPIDSLDDLDLVRYTHLILVGGDYKRVSESARGRLGRWLREGGTLVATKTAAVWVSEHLTAGGESTQDRGAPPQSAEPQGEKGETRRLAYGDYQSHRAAQLISGAIFEVELDLTHPLAFGYPKARLPVFRSSTLLLAPSENPYENVALHTQAPLISGYTSQENLERLRGSAAVVARKEGRGTVILLADDPTFRGFWYGTQKLLLNAVFFGPQIQRTMAPETWE